MNTFMGKGGGGGRGLKVKPILRAVTTDPAKEVFKGKAHCLTIEELIGTGHRLGRDIEKLREALMFTQVGRMELASGLPTIPHTLSFLEDAGFVIDGHLERPKLGSSHNAVTLYFGQLVNNQINNHAACLIFKEDRAHLHWGIAHPGNGFCQGFTCSVPRRTVDWLEALRIDRV